MVAAMWLEGFCFRGFAFVSLASSEGWTQDKLLHYWPLRAVDNSIWWAMAETENKKDCAFEWSRSLPVLLSGYYDDQHRNHWRGISPLHPVGDCKYYLIGGSRSWGASWGLKAMGSRYMTSCILNRHIDLQGGLQEWKWSDASHDWCLATINTVISLSDSFC